MESSVVFIDPSFRNKAGTSIVLSETLNPHADEISGWSSPLRPLAIAALSGSLRVRR
jgi:hypothetical protein